MRSNLNLGNILTEEDEKEDIYKINDEYEIYLDSQIGSGAFGKIFKCKNTVTKEIFAAKIESLTCSTPQLLQEVKTLTQMKGKFGFPLCHKLINTKQDRVMIMDLLGPNLDDIKQKMPNEKFSMKTSLMIVQQMITRLKDLHSNGFVHRDMKPENFVIGKLNKERIIYLIDFGLARKYINEKTHEHIPFKEHKPILGTARYISINAHLGYELSRRDDLESIGYIMIYFILGELPWQGQKCRTKQERYDKLLEKKKETVPNELCKLLPEEIKMYFQHVLSLKFEDTPDYEFLIKLLESLMNKYGYSNDMQFDWYTPSFLSIIYEPYNKTVNNDKGINIQNHISPKNVISKNNKLMIDLEDNFNNNISLSKKGKITNNALTCGNKINKSITFKKTNTSNNNNTNNKGKLPLKQKTFVSISNKRK